jgi:hypothetical protein
MDPQTLRDTWRLDSVSVAEQMLGGDPGTLGAPVVNPPQTVRPDVTLDQVATDAASLNRLNNARDRLIENAAVQLQDVNKGGTR